MANYELGIKPNSAETKKFIACFGISAVSSSDSRSFRDVALQPDVSFAKMKLISFEEVNLISTTQINERFDMLKNMWKADTAYMSSITQISMHNAYQQIIGMGIDVIPLILSEMQSEPDYWFWALRSITGDNPVLSEESGDIDLMTEAWLRWGREFRYIN